MADGSGVIRHIEAALDASGLRGRVIANNIANLGTAGFRRSDVRFEELLGRALEAGADLDDVRPEIFQPRDTPLNDKGSDVSLDMEIGEMVRNGLRSKVYLKTLAKLYDQMELAMRA